MNWNFLFASLAIGCPFAMFLVVPLVHLGVPAVAIFVAWPVVGFVIGAAIWRAIGRSAGRHRTR